MPNHFPRRRPIRVAAAAVGLGLFVSLAATGAAGAQSADRHRADDRAANDARPVDARPTRRTGDLEVLRLACAIADDRVDGAASDMTRGDRVADATRVRIGCRWRPAVSERAVGYQLWRIVDRGEREAVARGGLDMVGARDVVPASAHVVRYAVIAVDEHGRRVGQSRVERVIITERDDHDRRLADRARADRPRSR